MSEYLFIKCKKCDKEVSKSAKTCPQCGTSLKKTNKLFIAIAVIFGFVLISSLSSNENVDNSTEVNRELASEPQLPPDQAKFIEIVTKHISSFKNAKNELQESAFRDLRKDEIASNFKKRKVTNWHGTIQKLETNSEGKAILEVKISDDIIIKTWNNALSDIVAQTLIDKKSSVYKALLNMKEGDKVKFSGSFVLSETDHFEETSVTIRGSMSQPEFLFLFSNITNQ